MLVIYNSLNAHNFPIFQLILIILVSKFMVERAHADKTYLSLGLLSPLGNYYTALESLGPLIILRNILSLNRNETKSYLTY